MAKSAKDVLKEAKTLHNHGAFGSLQQAEFFKAMEAALTPEGSYEADEKPPPKPPAKPPAKPLVKVPAKVVKKS